MKTCYICQQEKPIEEFAKSTQRKDGYGSYCKPCDNERKRKWRDSDPNYHREFYRKYTLKWKKENPEKVKIYERRTDLKRKYGISMEEYDALFAKQDYRCAICKRSPNELEKGKNFPVDHCHYSNKVRGILCGPCNRGLGQFGDSVERLQNAIRYLESEGK